MTPKENYTFMPINTQGKLTSGGATEDAGTVNVCCSAFIMNHVAFMNGNNNLKQKLKKCCFLQIAVDLHSNLGLTSLCL
jgi:hypothetical protein